jgi:hypothetical protein
MKTEAVRSTETSVDYHRTALRYSQKKKVFISKLASG